LQKSWNLGDPSDSYREKRRFTKNILACQLTGNISPWQRSCFLKIEKLLVQCDLFLSHKRLKRHEKRGARDAKHPVLNLIKDLKS
jgi:hypothetical protein